MKKLIIVTVCLFTFLGICGCEQQETNNNTQNSTNEKTNKTLEPNTSAMVDNLILKGKEKAKSANETELNEALNYIKENIDNCFENNDVMANFIYYGSVLEYYYAKDNNSVNGFDNVKGEIGMNAVQAVKYVYRNAEKSTDNGPIENIKQVKEGFSKIQ